MKTILSAFVILIFLSFIMCKTKSSQPKSFENQDSLHEDTLKTKWFTIEKATELTGIDDRYDDLKANYILDEYSGMVSSTIRFENGMTSKSSTETFVIRNEADYTNFTERIYPYVLSKPQTREENNDLLRKKPKIDFSKHMLIVLVRNDNPLAEMQLSNINFETDPIIAIVRQKALSDAAKYSAYPLEIGAYNVYLVKKEVKEFQFIILFE